MNHEPHRRRQVLSGLVTALLIAASTAAAAHDFKLGALRIDHPYATPTPPGWPTERPTCGASATPATRPTA